MSHRPTRRGLRELINVLPRIGLVGGGPTPLHPLPRLAQALGIAALYVKRDDLTALALGGNKVRELEFILGEATAAGATVFVAGGGVSQSNHGRQCAAAARCAGMRAIIVLRRDPRSNQATGNLLVTRVLGAEVRFIDADPGVDDRNALDAAMAEVAREVADGGDRPYVLPSSFHPLAAIGYVDASIELADQLDALNVERAQIFVTSMGATHAGIALATHALDLPWVVTGVAWRPLQTGLADRLRGLAGQAAARIGLDVQPEPTWFRTLDEGGPAYGTAGRSAWEAYRLAARTDGLLLDPVYTAKGMAGLVASARNGTLDPEVPVVFVHTGGVPAMFAYGDDITQALELQS